jgi:hypothetical protein
MTSKRILTLVIISSAIAMVLATPALAQQTKVTVNAPETITSAFSVMIGIENAVNLDSGQFDLSFDPGVVNVTGVNGGAIGGTPVPISGWDRYNDGTIKVLFNLPGINGVSGSGNLAIVHFRITGSGDSVLHLSKGLLVDNSAKKTSADWQDGEVNVGTDVEVTVMDAPAESESEPESTTPTPTQADATGGETPGTETSGFGAVLAITGLLAVVYLLRRM